MHVIYNNTKDHNFIEKNKHYVVYALRLRNELEYAIQLDAFPSAPSFYNAKLFQLTDSRISSYWVKKLHSDEISLITFSKWANDDFFYQNLIDGNKNTRNLWQSFKKDIDQEFASPDLLHASQVLSEGWHLCYNCQDAWNPKNSGEIITCPNCYREQKRAIAQQANA